MTLLPHSVFVFCFFAAFQHSATFKTTLVADQGTLQPKVSRIVGIMEKLLKVQSLLITERLFKYHFTYHDLNRRGFFFSLPLALGIKTQPDDMLH